MRKNIFKLFIVAFVMILNLSFVNTHTVHAATKQVQGGRSMKSAKKISKSNTYVAKLKGEQSLWYKFKTSSNGTYLSYYAKNLSNTGSFRVYVYSKQGEKLQQSQSIYKNRDASGNCGHRLESNTWYYINVTNKGCYVGKGNVKFSFELNKDSIPNTMKQAKTVKIKKGYISSIDGKGDTDWFKFKPAKSGTYTFNLKSISGDIRGVIYSKYEEKLGGITVHDKEGSFSVKLSKNQWYYIKIYYGYSYGKTCTGRYRFSIE